MLALLVLSASTKGQKQDVSRALGEELSSLSLDEQNQVYVELAKHGVDKPTFDGFVHEITDSQKNVNITDTLAAYKRWVEKSPAQMSWQDYSQNKSFDEVADDPRKVSVILNCEDVIDLNQLDGFPTAICTDIRQRYAQANEQEKKVIDYMFGIMETPEHILHFFGGAHIEIRGNNMELYEQWRKDFEANEALKPRISSHVSTSNQYSVGGNFLKEVLFGTRADSGENYTWMQLEGAPVGGLKEFKEDFFLELMNFFEHMAHFIDYRINGKNIGPYGKSEYTEASPLRIDANTISEERQQLNRELWKAAFLVNPGVVTKELYERAQEINANRETLTPKV